MTTQWIISNNLAVLNNPKTQVWLERHFFSWWVGGFPHIFRVKVLRWVCSKRLRTRSQSCGLVIFLVLSGQLRWGSPGEEGGVRQRAHKVHIFWEGHKILRNLYLTFDWHYIYRTKESWRFHKILWPSQNKWAVFKIVLPSSIFCSQIQSNILSLWNDKIILTF